MNDKLEFEIKGKNREELIEKAWEIAGQFYGDEEHSLIRTSPADIADVISEESIAGDGYFTVNNFSATFTFMLGER